MAPFCIKVNFDFGNKVQTGYQTNYQEKMAEKGSFLAVNRLGAVNFGTKPGYNSGCYGLRPRPKRRG
jgi:hypothetical protein